jgi:hypothetical protein
MNTHGFSFVTHADLSSCATPLKNNFICVSFVKRDIRMRDAGSVSDPKPSVSILESDGTHAPILY